MKEKQLTKDTSLEMNIIIGIGRHYNGHVWSSQNTLL